MGTTLRVQLRRTRCYVAWLTEPKGRLNLLSAPKAQLDDGLLDLAVINHAPGGDLMRLSAELETPDNTDNKVLRYWQLPEFTIEAD